MGDGIQEVKAILNRSPPPPSPQALETHKEKDQKQSQPARYSNVCVIIL